MYPCTDSCTLEKTKSCPPVKIFSNCRENGSVDCDAGDISGDENVEPLTSSCLSPISISTTSSVCPDSYRLYKRRWFILASYCMLSMSASSVWLCFPAVTNILKAYFNCGLMRINFLSIVFAIILVVFSLPFAYLLDKVGLAIVLKLSALLNVVGASIRYFGSDAEVGYWFLLCGNIFTALSIASFLFLPGKIAATWFGEHETGKATAACIAFDALGTGLGFLHATAMISNSQYKDEVEEDLQSFLLSQLIPSVFVLLYILVVVQRKPTSPPSRMEFDRAESKRAYRAAKESKVTSPSESETLVQTVDITANYMTFKQSLVAILKDRNVHLIFHVHGIAASIESLYEMMLNEMLIPLYPGYEKSIGIVGFVAVMLGFMSNIAAGAIIDKTGSYKYLSVVIFFITSLCCTSWLFALEYFHSFVANAVIIGVLMVTVTAYYTVAFAHCTLVTYPVSTGVTGTMLVLTSQVYDTVMMFATTAIFEYFGVAAVNAAGVSLAVVATMLTFCFAKEKVVHGVEEGIVAV